MLAERKHEGMEKSKKSMTAVADALGVSRCTVSLVLSGRDREARIKPETAERIRDYCRKVGYQPNIHSRRMQSKIVRNIMVCVAPYICSPDRENVFSDGNFSGILGGIVTAAAAQNVNVSLSLCHFNQPETRDIVFNSFLSREVDGMIFYGMDIPENWLPDIVNEKFHIVGVHSNPAVGINNVDADNYRATRLMVTEFMLKRGRRRFVYVGGTALSPVNRERYRGFVDALGAYNIVFSEDKYIKSDFMEDVAAAKINDYIKNCPEMPDAIVCANDRMAIGVLKALLANGIRVPEDVAVCGSEGVELSRYVNPTLATWDQRSKEMGRAAFELLWHKVNGKEVENIVVEAELCEGTSIPPSIPQM